MPFRNTTCSRQVIVGAVLCLLFVLQQLLVPLHLAWSDHVYPGAPDRHVHSHAGPAHGAHGAHGHRHDHDPLAPGEPDPDHDPHPAADHLDQLAEPALPLTLVHVAIAPAPGGLAVALPDAPWLPRPEDAERGPRPPPPRAAAAPRAPPSVA